MIRIRGNSQASGVVYADCFFVENEYIIAMPPNCSNSCIFRVTVKLNWIKSCMIKSIIISKSTAEAKDQWLRFTDYIKTNGHTFKQVKSDKKLKHGIEKIQPKKDKPVTSIEDL